MSMTSRSAILSLLLLFTGIASANDNAAQNAEAWFVSDYVPLWANIETVDPVAVMQHWVDGFRDHPIDTESRTVENSVDQWRMTIARYRDGGIRNSILLSTSTEQINEFSVLIRARWKDDPPVGPNDAEFCDIYLVGKFSDGWKITNYFTVDCVDP